MKKIIALLLSLMMIPCIAVSAADLTGKENWKIEITNQATGQKFDKAEVMIDGKTDNFFHSPIVENLPPLPYDIVITLPSVTEINGVRYTPRATGNSDAGIWTRFEAYYTTDDSDNWTKIGTFDIQKSFDPSEVVFKEAVKAKKVKLSVVRAIRNYCVVSEIDLLTDAVSSAPEKEETASMPDSNPYIVSGGDKSGWQIEITNNAASARYNTEGVAKILDGSAETFWHSPTEQPIPALPYDIEITMPNVTEIGGILYTPRQNKNSDAGIVMGGDIYIAETDNGAWKKVKTFSIDKSFDPTEIPFGEAFKAKKIKITVTKSVRNYCVIAELDVLSKDKVTGEKVEVTEEPKKEEPAVAGGKGAKEGWKIEASHAQGTAGNMIDGDIATFWHSPITDPKTLPPFEMIITLPQLTDISGVIYTPRTTGSSDSGIVSKMEIYASETDDGELLKIGEYVLAQTKDVKTMELAANIMVKKLKFVVTEGRNNYGVIAELDIRPATEGYKDMTVTEYVKNQEAMKLYEMDKTFLRAWSESIWGDDFVGQNVFDASPSGDKMWHYKPGTPMPVTLDVDLNGVAKVAAFAYTPRVKDTSGHWVEFNLLSSVDGENYTPVIEERRLDPSSFDTVTIRFDEPVTARYFRFEILNGRGGHAACQELSFYQFKEDQEEYLENNREIYVLKIGSNVLNVTHGKENFDVDLGVAPFIVSGTTMIPLRGLLEQMGANVEWDGTIDQITITKKGNETMIMQVEHEPVLIGGRRYSMLIAPRIVNSRTFIPLRFVSEHLGYDVAWDGATQTITITKPL
ncbi:MAG: discoidin domain-containing protein [Clostridia bacterium]|nr:discoidin domain-containing protein [Clostridia bacterium]